MKKILLLIIVFSLSISAFSQVEWGVKAGLNLANMSNAELYDDDFNSIDSKMKPSFHVGVFATIPLSEYISFQPEIMYSRQGAFFKESFGGESVKIWARYNYVNIPLVFRFHVMEKLSVDVGPQFGIATDVSAKFKVGSSSYTEDADSDDYQTFDVSAAMGLTYKVCQNIDIYARYNLGFTDVEKHNDGDKIKNNVIQVGVGYRF